MQPSRAPPPVPAHLALSLAQLLIKSGADVNANTKLRGSPLHAAAQHGTGRAVAALLDRCGVRGAGLACLLPISKRV